MLAARNQSGGDAHDWESSTSGRVHPASPAVDDSHPVGGSHDRVLHDAVDRGRPVPARAAARALERGLGEVRGPPAAGDPPEPAREVRPRPALVPAVRQLSEGRRDTRLRAVAVVSVHAGDRHHQADGAALGPARAAGVRVGDPHRDSRRHPGRAAAGVVFRLCRPRPHRPRHLAAQLPRRHAAHLLRVGEARSAPDLGLGRRLAEQGAADSHPEPRADGLLRAAPARHAARDPGERLRPDGPSKGPVAEAHRRRPRAQELVAAPDRRGRADVRCDGHRLVHRREHLRHPGHLEVLRRLGGRPRLHGGHGRDDRPRRDDHLPEPARGHRPPHARPAACAKPDPPWAPCGAGMFRSRHISRASRALFRSSLGSWRRRRHPGGRQRSWRSSPCSSARATAASRRSSNSWWTRKETSSFASPTRPTARLGEAPSPSAAATSSASAQRSPNIQRSKERSGWLPRPSHRAALERHPRATRARARRPPTRAADPPRARGAASARGRSRRR